MLDNNYNDINNEKRYNNRTIEPYNRNNRDNENNNYNNRYEFNNSVNKSTNYRSPLKSSYSLLMDYPTKTKRFQNENLVVYRVSPYHCQYRYRIYDDMNYNNNNYTRDKINGDQSYNVEKEKINNQYGGEGIDNRNSYNSPQSFRNSENPDKFRNSNNDNRTNYIDNRIYKYRTPNNGNNVNYLRDGNNQFINSKNINDISKSQQIEEKFINRNDNYRRNDNDNYNHYNEDININDNRGNIRRNNSDFNYIDNRNIEKEKGLRQYYLKNPIDYYRGEEIDNEYRHYSPLSNDYNGSRFGDYTYNYYLNAPMRGDKSEDWRFPPLYYYHPNYDSKRKIYTNYH